MLQLNTKREIAMPYSKKFESEYRVLAQDQFNGIVFNSPEDFDAFFKAIKKIFPSLLPPANNRAADPLPLRDHKEAVLPNIYEKVIAELKTFIDECFDLYAGDRIVDLVTEVMSEMKPSDVVATAAFTSKNPQSTKADKINEARAELQAIILDEFKKKIEKFFKMTLDERIKFIADKKQERETTKANQKRMQEQKAPVGEANTAAAEAREREEDARLWRVAQQHAAREHDYNPELIRALQDFRNHVQAPRQGQAGDQKLLIDRDRLIADAIARMEALERHAELDALQHLRRITQRELADERWQHEEGRRQRQAAREGFPLRRLGIDPERPPADRGLGFNFAIANPPAILGQGVRRQLLGFFNQPNLPRDRNESSGELPPVQQNVQPRGR